MDIIYNPKHHTRSLLTFNVFFREDTSTRQFLKSIIAKNPEHWAFFRNVFKGRTECSLTLVDRSIETPFHCLLVAVLCKQLKEELGINFKRIKLMLSPLHEEVVCPTVWPNTPFVTTDDRNDFLQKCFSTILGQAPVLMTKRNPIFCRDMKISSRDYTLFIRVEGGVAHGWQLAGDGIRMLTPRMLLEKCDDDLTCQNIFTHAFSRNGVFFNFDLLAKASLCSHAADS